MGAVMDIEVGGFGTSRAHQSFYTCIHRITIILLLSTISQHHLCRSAIVRQATTSQITIVIHKDNKNSALPQALQRRVYTSTWDPQTGSNKLLIGKTQDGPRTCLAYHIGPHHENECARLRGGHTSHSTSTWDKTEDIGRITTSPAMYPLGTRNAELIMCKAKDITMVSSGATIMCMVTVHHTKSSSSISNLYQPELTQSTHHRNMGHKSHSRASSSRSSASRSLSFRPTTISSSRPLSLRCNTTHTTCQCLLQQGTILYSNLDTGRCATLSNTLSTHQYLRCSIFPATVKYQTLFHLRRRNKSVL